MPRVLTKAGELMANADMLRRELDAEREVSKLLAEALGWSHGTVCKDPECHANAALAKYREGL